MSDDAQNSVKNSVKGKRRGPGNPAKIKPYEFEKGESGNPGGRPKGRKLSSAYAAILETLFPGDSLNRTYAEMIALAQAREAIKGKTQAAAEMADRTEGRPNQSMTFNGEIALDLEQIDAKLAEYTERVRARAAERKGKA